MGFIHETNSEIFGTEERKESFYLSDKSNDHDQMFFFHQRPDDIRAQIVNLLMKKAGETFAAGDEKTAAKLKSSAEDVKNLDLDLQENPAVIEVTFAWLRDLLNFFKRNPTIMEMIGMEIKPSEKVSIKYVLLNVQNKLKLKYRKTPLWALVVDICSVGSTTASQICREFGWNAEQDAGKEIIEIKDQVKKS